MKIQFYFCSVQHLSNGGASLVNLLCLKLTVIRIITIKGTLKNIGMKLVLKYA